MSRRARLAVGVVPAAALYLAAAVMERLFWLSDSAFFALRDWMDIDG